jgi:hypothetical protein
MAGCGFPDAEQSNPDLLCLDPPFEDHHVVREDLEAHVSLAGVGGLAGQGAAHPDPLSFPPTFILAFHPIGSTKMDDGI